MMWLISIVRVVDDDREVVQRRAVAPDDHEVAADVGGVDLDLAADQVVASGPLPAGPGTGVAAARPSASRAARSSGVRFAQRPT